VRLSILVRRFRVGGDGGLGVGGEGGSEDDFIHLWSCMGEVGE
jgi:hypothetical protein